MRLYNQLFPLSQLEEHLRERETAFSDQVVSADAMSVDDRTGNLIVRNGCPSREHPFQPHALVQTQELVGALQSHLTQGVVVGEVLDADRHLAALETQDVGDGFEGGQRQGLELLEAGRHAEFASHGSNSSPIRAVTESPRPRVPCFHGAEHKEGRAWRNP